MNLLDMAEIIADLLDMAEITVNLLDVSEIIKVAVDQCNCCERAGYGRDQYIRCELVGSWGHRRRVDFVPADTLTHISVIKMQSASQYRQRLHCATFNLVNRYQSKSVNSAATAELI